MSRKILTALFLAIVGAGAAPDFATAESISGSVPDLTRRITASGMSVTASFGQITYDAQLKGIRIAATREHRVEFDVDLSAISLRIGKTELRGAVFSADVGPLLINLARTRPLVVRYVATPTAEGLTLESTQLALTSVDMQIANPNVVRTSGFGATKSRVGRGLRDGLRNNREAIEGILMGEIKNIFNTIQPKLSKVVATQREQVARKKAAAVASSASLTSSEPAASRNDEFAAANSFESVRKEALQKEASTVESSKEMPAKEPLSLPVATVVVPDEQSEELPAVRSRKSSEKNKSHSVSSNVSLSGPSNKVAPATETANAHVVASTVARSNGNLVDGRKTRHAPVRTRQLAGDVLAYCRPNRPQLGARLLKLLRLQ